MENNSVAVLDVLFGRAEGMIEDDEDDEDDGDDERHANASSIIKPYQTLPIFHRHLIHSFSHTRLGFIQMKQRYHLHKIIDGDHSCKSTFLCIPDRCTFDLYGNQASNNKSSNDE